MPAKGQNQDPSAGSETYWAFRNLQPPPVPDVQSVDRVRTPIDRFLLAKLEARGLGFSPDADRVTLLRRVSLDVTGLPPTPDEAAAFLSDETPQAYERLVDRLLASPALWRALGTALAGRGGLCRHDRLRHRCDEHHCQREQMALSRLCDRRLEPGQAFRSLSRKNKSPATRLSIGAGAEHYTPEMHRIAWSPPVFCARRATKRTSRKATSR